MEYTNKITKYKKCYFYAIIGFSTTKHLFASKNSKSFLLTSTQQLITYMVQTYLQTKNV